jgi:hypothetical protein
MDEESLKVTINAIRSCSDKDSKAYRITKYYCDLTSGNLDEGGIVLARSKVLSIEKELKQWLEENPPNSEATIRQPSESAIILINDLRSKGFLD